MKYLLTICLMVITSMGGLKALASSEQAAEESYLVIYRTIYTSKTRGINYRIYVNGEQVGKLKDDSVFKLPLAPGEYIVKAEDKKRNQITVEVKAGETIYVSGSVDRRRNMDFEVTTPDEELLAKITD